MKKKKNRRKKKKKNKKVIEKKIKDKNSPEIHNFSTPENTKNLSFETC